MTQTNQTYGILAEYDSAHAVYEACKKVRDAGYSKWDACTPFAVHGLDKAMGLKPSVLPWFVLAAGITGGVLMTVFMIWTSVYDYPLNIGGKPTWSIPAFVPPAFEVTILFAALTAVFGMFFLNRLPTFHHPLFNSKRFERVTDDRFFIVIETQDPLFEMNKTHKLLEETGAVNLEMLEN
jgi:hypothetical protein